MLTKLGIVAVIAITGTFAIGLQQQSTSEIRNSSPDFMQRKLDFTRDVIDGLATENFDKISKGAQDLLVLSHEAEWSVITSPKYVELSTDFRKTVDRLRDQSSKKNLDGATLAYFEVTLSCIRCHKQVRNGFDPVKKK